MTFFSNDDGATAIIFAFTAVVLMAVTGLALDSGIAYQRKQAAQATLDAAILAAVKAESDAEGVFAAHIQATGDINGPATVKLVPEANSVLAEARATTSYKTAVMSMFGYKNMNINVSSSARAPKKISEFRLRVKDSYGWYNKDVRFRVEREDGTKETIATVTYRMKNPKGENWRGTGVTQAKPARDVLIGPYKSIWLEMTVYEPNRTVIYSTANPKTAKRVFVDGKQVAKTGVPALNDLFPCGHSPIISMEDGAEADTANWWAQDIFFEVEVNCDQTDGTQARLVK